MSVQTLALVPVERALGQAEAVALAAAADLALEQALEQALEPERARAGALVLLA